MNKLRIRVSDLHSAHKPNAYEGDLERIKKSIMVEGFINPIVVWSTTPAIYNAYQAQNPSLLPYENETETLLVYVVMCGNNRLEIAKQLGFEDIEAIIFNKREEVSRECNRQRKSWTSQQSVMGLR